MTATDRATCAANGGEARPGGLLARMSCLAAGVGGLVVGARAFTRWRGDSHMAWTGHELGEVARVGDTVTGTVGIENRGTSLGVVRRVYGRIVDGGTGTVLATLRGSRPPDRGWWVSNILRPGESCVAAIDLMLREEPAGPVVVVVVELTLQEMGRRLFQYRTTCVTAPLPAPARQA